MARRFRSQEYQRMTKQWISAQVGGTNSHTANSTNLLAALSFFDPETVLRIRGTWQVAFRAATTALDEAIITLAIGVVSTDAAAAGAGSVPDPVSDSEYPWIFYDIVHMFSPFAIDGTGSDDSGALIVRRDIDSKAMRKIKPGQDLIMVSQYVDSNGTPAVQVSGNTRVLIGSRG